MIGLILKEIWPQLAAGVGVLLVILSSRSKGKKAERLKMKNKDVQNAREIRNRVDETIENVDSSIPVDDRLRKHGKLRD